MVRKIILISFLLIAVLGCHYSCQNCMGGNHFTQCTQCKEGVRIQYIKQIILDDNSLFKNLVPVGVCRQQDKTPRVNAYGIIMLILITLSYGITKKKYSFQFISSLQNLAYLGLLEIGYIDPLRFLWNGLKYFYIFSSSTAIIKTQQNSLTINNKYNIQDFLKDSDYFSNISLIIVSNVMVFILTLNLFRKFFICGRKYSQKCETILTYIQNFSKLVFFFTIAEQLLVIETSLVYGLTKDQAYFVIALFFLELVLYLFYINYFPIQMGDYQSKFIMYKQLIKKVIFSLLTVFNVSPVILPCSMIAILIFQFIYQFIIVKKRYWKVYLYRSLQGLVLITFILYVIGDLAIWQWNYSEAFSYLSSFALCFYSLIPIIEIFTYYRRKVWQSNIKSQIIHQVSNSTSNLPNVQTQIYLPQDIANPQIQHLNNMPTLITQINIDDDFQNKKQSQKISTQNKSNSRLPVKSNSQNSFLKSKQQLNSVNTVKQERSQTKSQRMIIKDIIKQQPRQKQGATIEVINLDRVVKKDKQTLHKNHGQYKSSKVMRNNSQFQYKTDEFQAEIEPVAIPKRAKRRINRQKYVFEKDDNEENNEDQEQI